MQQNIKEIFSSHPDKLHCMAEKQVKKRKRNDISRNNKGKYQCQQCDYEARRSSCLKKHVESIHEGVYYPCGQCDYKATQVGHLKTHVKSVHEHVRYPCDQCDYKATVKGNLKTHRKLKHQ